MYFLKRIAVVVLALFTALTMASCATNDGATNVYLVRHAEKVIGENVGRDPELTEAGQRRAHLLAELLADKKITRIHSSDFIRTRDTAKPLADATGLAIEIYDPMDLEGLAAKIENARGSHLVVGHSNTIPETVVALSGDGGSPIEEGGEYDRLYKLRISSNGKVLTKLSRYGEAHSPTEK